ncbi:MAG: NIPSNAP family protein, partial [Armatimonadetes bacterium]|nr:NIPSNAP family protein [Akkermansiaceae bacterium]
DVSGKGRCYEMRTYTATPGNLPALHSRFRDHTQALFEKHRMTNLGYFNLTPDQKNADSTLLYFLAHEDAAAAVKSWIDFRSDPVWVAAKEASEKQTGKSLTAEEGIKSMFLEPTDFSPLR